MGATWSHSQQEWSGRQRRCQATSEGHYDPALPDLPVLAEPQPVVPPTHTLLRTPHMQSDPLAYLAEEMGEYGVW